MRPLKIILAVVVAIVLGGGVLVTKTYWWNSWQTDSFQSQFDEFYAVPDPIVGEVGDIVRQERAPDYDVKDGEATRILFVSETEAGEKRVSGGTVWTPTKASAPAQDRRVVAWAHPTLGLGVSCSPSRQSELNLDPAGIVPGMMAKNWVVTAADYVGLGTPPQEQTYLIGQQEARDVINSVRAARNLSDGAAGKQWAVYGHSQGGHASLWA
ncbi:MAG: lipase family protein, partial [Actinomycetia bacterium]|nr:lipase family protein [Actinomycetes bacterium]